MDEPAKRPPPPEFIEEYVEEFWTVFAAGSARTPEREAEIRKGAERAWYRRPECFCTGECRGDMSKCPNFGPDKWGRDWRA